MTYRNQFPKFDNLYVKHKWSPVKISFFILSVGHQFFSISVKKFCLNALLKNKIISGEKNIRAQKFYHFVPESKQLVNFDYLIIWTNFHPEKVTMPSKN